MTKRGVILSAVGGAGALLATLTFGTLESSCQREQNAYHTQTSGNQGTQKTQFAMDRRWLPCVVERATADPQVGQTNQKEQRDLIAQETSAGVAFWILMIAALQLIATTWGLLYIRGTLRATLLAVSDTSKATRAMERQNEIADSTAKRQLRAYVGISDVMLCGNGHIWITIKNFGNTPAYHVVAWSKRHDGKARRHKIRILDPGYEVRVLHEWPERYRPPPRPEEVVRVFVLFSDIHDEFFYLRSCGFYDTGSKQGKSEGGTRLFSNGSARERKRPKRKA